MRMYSPLIKDKKYDIVDFTQQYLSFMEDILYQRHKEWGEECPLNAETFMHHVLISALTFRFLSKGWTEKEIIKLFKDELTESKKNFDELEEEDRQMDLLKSVDKPDNPNKGN